MCETTINYNNADGLFRFDEAIREAMSRWPGGEIDSGEDLKTHVRHITYAFEDEGDDSAALKNLAEILGDDRFEEITYMGKPQVPTDTGKPLVPVDACRVINLDQRKRSAQEIFYGYSRRLGWDFTMQADVLVNWFDEGMIEPLLQRIQEEGQTEDFEEFLAETFGDDALREDQLLGHPASERPQVKDRSDLRIAQPKTGPNDAVADVSSPT